MNGGTLWILRDLLESLTAEASIRVPCETGGVLLGYWAKGDGDPVVTHCIGPGPNATHSETRFQPDHDYQVTEIARLYKDSDRRLHYLGDWHSHPDGGGTLSRLDRACLRRIARCREARVDEPVMMILAGSLDWEPFAWRLGWVRSWLCWKAVPRTLAVRPFEAF